MSSIAVTGSATGTGVISLLAPVTNTNRTINLPDSNGTIVTSATAGVPIGGPAFSAYNNGSTTSLTGGVWTKIVLNTEEFDTNTNFDSTTNYRFTPTVAGYYQIAGTVASSWSTTAPTWSRVAIYKNGTIFKWGEIGALATDIGSVSVSSIIQFNGSTDYIELYFNSQSATPLYVGGSAYTYMSGALIRSAV